MKKVLIGLAAAAMAVVGTGAGSASATTTTLPSPTSDTIWDIITGGDMTKDGIDALKDLGIDDLLDNCGLPYYTVFIPGVDAGGAIYGTEAFLDVVVDALGYASFVDAVDLNPTLVKGLLAYHVVPSLYAESTLANELATNLKNLAGGNLVISDGDGIDSFEVDGIPVTTHVDACNGIVFPLGATEDSILMPAGKLGDPTCGVTAVGGCPAASGTGTGTGLPKTGSESMALTYAALATLIAGAGVLVIRRRSVA